MGEIISILSQKYKRAAERRFREWRRLFQSVAALDALTRWADLPDEVVVFFCEENAESKHSFYDLLMSSLGLGNGYEFESQPFERLETLMNAYFFLTDQARFECMRRLGWLSGIPREEKPIIESAMAADTLDYPALFETPEPTPAHPAYEEDRTSKGVDRAALVRRAFPDAIRLFKNKIKNGTSVV